MSFGAPGGGSVNYKPSPPERGSFPLDHEAKAMELITIRETTGECKHIISGYLKCIKMNKGTNDEACRKLAKEYLSCRMDKNLMAPDNFENLGLVFKDGEGKGQTPATPAASPANPEQKR
ncbi:hypothetical protein N7489_004000 [Penicillium chrysogenum]|uniref:Cytochrome c oxidase assembly protein n=1 Tax=Penicillium chrysogenum TaxID=5076 RepID=A0ABQ8WRV5_PENCH|nr:uncharacterized protein N7489_004000 [Penicillium chrysogenum]KAJ5243904.1 hypothetical protein N7489_004000 [Penicillium chrysogenum]KAJ5275452.1 hypothetical protein N7505_003997 [Penicillium chrysogenum]KAJ6157178.1 hypothetical protein N7497_006063 [Penicillium chrysogenum]